MPHPTAREWLNILAILESIDEVPGMPPTATFTSRQRSDLFVRSPDKCRALRKADDPTRAAIWAEVMRRLPAEPVVLAEGEGP